MRVMMLRPGPAFSVADVHVGWREAFVALGCAVADINLDDRLSFYSNAGRLDKQGEFVHALDFDAAVWLASQSIQAALYEWPADVLFVTSCFFVPFLFLDNVRAHGTKVVICCTEEPYETTAELTRAEHADLVILNDPVHIDRFRAVTDAIYLPAAYRPSVHHRGLPTPGMESDFCLVGTGFPSRVRFLERVDWTGLNVALGGMWQTLTPDSPLNAFLAHDPEHCLDNAETVKAYQSTKASANLYRREADDADSAEGWAMGPREVELAATGTFFLREPRPEGDTVLSMVPRFTGPEDFGVILRWFLGHDAQRATVAGLAREAVADRTFSTNAVKLLRRVETL